MTETNSPPPLGEPAKVAEIPTTLHPRRQMQRRRRDKRLTVRTSSPHKGKKKERKRKKTVRSIITYGFERNSLRWGTFRRPSPPESPSPPGHISPWSTVQKSGYSGICPLSGLSPFRPLSRAPAVLLSTGCSAQAIVVAKQG